MGSQVSSFHISAIITILMISCMSIHLTCVEESNFGRTINPKALALGHEKLSHFRFFWHDSVNTAFTILDTQKTTNNSFGFINMIDDPLTLGPELNSKVVGRAQGFYAAASLWEFALMMKMNFVFTEGKYNGSTISVDGRNLVFHTVRELAVVGGTGVFRFARGFASFTTTHSYTKGIGEVDEYNVYIMHY